MEGYLLIFLFAILNVGESVLLRDYARRHGNGGMLMNAMIALFFALFFLVIDTDGFYVPAEMLPLALINSLLYAAGFYFLFLAFRIGPFGLSRLINGFSLLFTVFYGIFFLHERTTVLTYIGLLLIAVAMVLINLKGKPREGGLAEEGRVSLRWLVFVLISLVSNGFIGILARMQQIQFDNACTNEFLFISNGICCLILAALGLILDRKWLRDVLRHGTLFGLGIGLCGGAKSFVALAAYLFIPISVADPLKSGLGIVMTFLVAILLYREKYTLRQKLGVLAGAAAVVLLAL